MLNRVAPQQMVLACGATAVWDHDPTHHGICLGAIVWSGSHDDPPGLEGISHFLEHAPFLGTARYPSSYDLAFEVDRRGGDINANTWTQRTIYFVHMPAQHARLAWDILFEVLFRARFTPSNIEGEREVIKAEISQSENNMPWSCTYWSLSRLSGRELADRSRTLGTIESLDRIGPAELQVHYYRTHLPNNMTLIAAGNLEGLGASWAEFLDRQLASYGSHAPMARRMFVPIHENLPDHLETTERPVRSVRIEMAGPFHDSGERENIMTPYGPALVLARNILFDRGPTCRFFQDLRRRRNLVYTSGGDFSVRDVNFGTWSFSATVKAPDRAEEALLAVREILDDEETWSNAQVELAKEAYVGDVAMKRRSAHGIFQFIASDLEDERRIYTESEYIQRVMDASAEDVAEVAHHVFDPSRTLSIIYRPS